MNCVFTGQREMPLCATRMTGCTQTVGSLWRDCWYPFALHGADYWAPAGGQAWLEAGFPMARPRDLQSPRDTCRVPGFGTVPGEMSFPHWLGNLLTQAVSQAGMYVPWEHLLFKAIILACVLVVQMEPAGWSFLSVFYQKISLLSVTKPSSIITSESTQPNCSYHRAFSFTNQSLPLEFPIPFQTFQPNKATISQALLSWLWSGKWREAC